MSMLTPNDKFTFGKHKGKLIGDVMKAHPDYIYWMHCSGFSDFGKEITLFIHYFEEHLPDAARKVKMQVESRKASAIAAEARIDRYEEKLARELASTPKAAAATSEAWGSW